MKQFAKGVYDLKNPQKYAGKKAPFYRSSWELTFMRMCDTHPNVLTWDSEPVRIPYKHPFTGKVTVYVPDFLVVYIDKQGKKNGELVEIKPRSQTMLEAVKSKRDKAHLAVNGAKWKACAAWCKKKGLNFRVLNEDNIYQMKS
jgi:hypothetical protein